MNIEAARLASCIQLYSLVNEYSLLIPGLIAVSLMHQLTVVCPIGVHEKLNENTNFTCQTERSWQPTERARTLRWVHGPNVLSESRSGSVCMSRGLRFTTFIQQSTCKTAHFSVHASTLLDDCLPGLERQFERLLLSY